MVTPILANYICNILKKHDNNDWWNHYVLSKIRNENARNFMPQDGSVTELADSLDILKCLDIIIDNWDDVFGQSLPRLHRSLAIDLKKRRHELSGHITGKTIKEFTNSNVDYILKTLALFMSEIDKSIEKRINELKGEASDDTHVEPKPVSSSSVGLPKSKVIAVKKVETKEKTDKERPNMATTPDHLPAIDDFEQIWLNDFGNKKAAHDYCGREVRKDKYNQDSSPFGWCIEVIDARGPNIITNWQIVNCRTHADRKWHKRSFIIDGVRYISRYLEGFPNKLDTAFKLCMCNYPYIDKQKKFCIIHMHDKT